MKYRNYITGAAATALLFTAGTTFAADTSFGGDSLSAKPSISMSNMTLTVTGPNGYYAKEYSSHQAPSLSLSKNGTMADGLYNWELTGATSKQVEANPMGLDNGRGSSARKFVSQSMTESGSFRVVGGSIVAPDGAMEEPVSSKKNKE